jgi:hypothetical protein
LPVFQGPALQVLGLLPLSVVSGGDVPLNGRGNFNRKVEEVKKVWGGSFL